MIDGGSSLAGMATKAAGKELLKRFMRLASRNDEQHARDRQELALAWGAELKAAFPQVVEQLNERIDDLENKLSTTWEDPQFARVYTNFGYEAAREAIDERRRMLAHAAAGIIDPELPVEQKARVERTLRELDPIDVRVLFGISFAARTRRGRDRNLSELLFRATSGDVLVASGCVRVTTEGNGAGALPFPDVTVTVLGENVLSVLRSYVMPRGAPFVIPGREFVDGDRTEADARTVLAGIPALAALRRHCLRTRPWVHRTYCRKSQKDPSLPSLTFYFYPWAEVAPLVEKLEHEVAGGEMKVIREMQPYQPSEHEHTELLRVEIYGPRDVLRHFADDCEAPWE